MHFTKLDAIDLRILSRLRDHGRISNQELAEDVSLSPSACLRRLRLLEEAGIIAGYRTVFDAENLGVEIEAIVHVAMRQDIPDWHDTFLEALKDWPEVVSAYIVTGDTNYVLHVQAQNLKHYSTFIVEKLYRTAGVMNIQSNIVLQRVKENGGPLDILMARQRIARSVKTPRQRR